MITNTIIFFGIKRNVIKLEIYIKKGTMVNSDCMLLTCF